MEFLTSKELQLNAAGYLTSTETKKPVNHAGYHLAQSKAEYIVKLAEAIKGKTFVAPKLDNLEAIKAAVKAGINDRTHEYKTAPTKPTSSVNDEMVKFALDFAKYEDQKGDVARINAFMSQFDSINNVETVGEYFSEEVVRLNKIYTIAEILAAVETNIAVLG